MVRARKARVNAGFEAISPDEIVALGEFLDRKPLSKRSMGIPMLDGFLTAIVIGPEMVMPSYYLPWIWDWKRGKKDVEFADDDEANRIFGYLQGMNNRVAGLLMNEPPSVVPIFIFEPDWDHMEWVAGFVVGTGFDPEVWEYARKEIPEHFRPFEALTGMTPASEGWEDACVALSASFVRVRDYFRAGDWRRAFKEVQPPLGRPGRRSGGTIPCPCGSGRKFKKCCGETGGVIH